MTVSPYKEKMKRNMIKKKTKLINYVYLSKFKYHLHYEKVITRNYPVDNQVIRDWD
jgi:hypothetical protein